MFVRPCWEPKTITELYDLIDANPWALVVNNGDHGPYATNLPLLLNRSKGKHGTLVSHLAISNEHARALREGRSPTLAIFEGPYAYVTSSWYPNRDMPPTYYYTAVHCYGQVSLQSEAELERWLGVLTNRMESPLTNGWKMSEIPHQDITRRLPLIMGFELGIERIEGKFKLGQDEPKKDAMAVARQLAEADDPSHRALGQMVDQYNTHRSS
jgi:transcriptional regulator